MNAIYHLVWESDFKTKTTDGLYRADSLAIEGFIHCTREPEKVVEVANLFFTDVRPEPLLRLMIDQDVLTSEVRDEDPGVGHLFPHLYGPLNTNAIRAIDVMQRSEAHWQSPR